MGDAWVDAWETADGVRRCPTCKRAEEDPWSLAQQRLLRLWEYRASDHIKLEDKRYSKEAWHEYLCRRFLGTITLDLPGGHQVERTITTTWPHRLSRKAMAKFVDEVKEFLGDRGVWLDET